MNKCVFHHLFNPDTDICTDCGITKAAYFALGQATFVPWYAEDADTPYVVKCECGSDAVGSPFHSTWCPKYEEQK